MKNATLLLFVLLIVQLNTVKAQKNYIGRVVDKTKSGINYLTVKLIKQNISTRTGDNGQFNIQSPKIIVDDTLSVSGIGYKTIRIPINNFQHNSILQIQEDTTYLKQVNISNKLIETSINENSLKNDLPSSFSYQLAVKLEAPKQHNNLKSISIARKLNYFDKNNYVKFRIRVYDTNPVTGGPGDDLCHEIIEIEDFGKPIITFDVEKYRIRVPEGVFFLSLEKLLIPLNERVELESRTAKTGRTDIRTTIFTFDVNYEPTLLSSVKRKGETWLLDHQGDLWKKVNMSTSLSVKVTD